MAIQLEKLWPYLKGILIVVLVIAGGEPSIGIELDISTGLGLEYSDNINRSATNEEEWTPNLSLGLNFSHDSPRIIALADAQANYLKYLNETFADELLFELGAELTWKVVPGRLSWFLQDRFLQIREDTLEPETPDNRQNTNVISTGPDLTLKLRPGDFLEFSARAGHSYFDTTSDDHQRYSGDLRWRHLLTPVMDFSTGIRVETVDFTDEEENVDFIRTEAFLQFALESSLSTLNAEMGVIALNLEGADDEEPSLLATLEWRRRLARKSAVGVLFSTGLTDLGEILLADPEDPLAVDISEATIEQDILREQRLAAFYETRRGFWNLNWDGFWRDEDFKIVDEEDRMTWGTGLNLGYQFSATLATSAFGDYQRSDYSNIDRVDEDLEVGIQATQRLGRSLFIEVSLAFASRDSNIPDENFDETVAQISLTYGRRSPLIFVGY